MCTSVRKRLLKEVLKLIEFIIAVRDHTKGEETTARIKAENGSGHVDYFLLELTSLKSVRSFVGEYKKRTNGKKIDFLIENAGVMVSPSYSKN
jgi:NADP-dependent 3-hydroxy acid dehydrogenase YdfG